MLRENEGTLDQLLQIMDLFFISFSFYCAVDLYRFKHVIKSDIPVNYFMIFIMYILLWLFITNSYRIYESRQLITLPQVLFNLVKTSFISFALCLVALNFYDPKLISDHFIWYFVAITLAITLTAHTFMRFVLQTWRKSGYNINYVLLIGNGAAAKTYIEKIEHNPQAGRKVIGYLAPYENDLDVPYLGDYSRLEEVVKSNVIDITVVTVSLLEGSIKECLELLDAMGKKTVVMLDDMVAKLAHCRSVNFGGLSMVIFDSHPYHPWQRVIKQFFDMAVTSLGLLLISPIMLIIAIAIKATSKGPAIFSQDRVGLNGRIFKMYKFRSMVQDAEELKAALAHQNEMSGPVFKIREDPRVTPIGRFLRKTSLDELPQLWNVLKQDMSLVGPRPPLPNEVNLYDPKHRKRLVVRPGITCIWQISGRNDVGFEQWMDMDAEYVDRWSLWLDFEILLKTVPVVLLGRGAS
ncbi:MAG: sugar transferase [Eubacteriaceae bacterium]|nr:sugar transferase [Eubacteriaceae bacterium]